ncbi:MAG: hypothetical protein KC483_03220 [Nitrosarchaeum sp.]|nr:hypothetical protein [Nitrosarchaeum sp.]
MNTKNILMTTTIGMVAIAAITILGINNAFAEETDDGYKMADDIKAIFTFKFKDGIEIHEFPVFNMDTDYIANSGSPSFSVEGVVGNAPHLHKALDEAFKYKQNPSYEWNYQLFEVTIDLQKNDNTIKTLEYHDCYVDDYHISTQNDDYESYLSSSSGFAIIDNMEFLCGGLNILSERASPTRIISSIPSEYGQNEYKFAEEIRTFVTFEFDQGLEKIEFPYFEITSGFEEEDDNVVPGFSVESTIIKHPLLDKAIDNARRVSGLANGFNIDFEATVQFTKDSDVLRTIKYKDCRISDYEIVTETDKEEGFTGKSGFALVENIGTECIGVDTDNPSMDRLIGDTPIWKVTNLQNSLPDHEYPLGTGPMAIVTFTYDDGTEEITFPIFEQGDVLVKSNPRFELGGIVGDFPMLYKRVDDNLSLTSTTGANNFIELFNVDVTLVHNGESIRGFNYVDCRVTDYTVKTQRDKEESYFKGFALSNTFEFECQGYHPNNPVYDRMFNIYEKAKTINTNDLRRTDQWGPGFYVE